MRRRRCDSPWNKLTDEQQKQMDAWYFDESLSCREIHDRARRTFGIDASRQTLTAYFRHRESKRVLAGGGRLTADQVNELLLQRTGAGMSLEDLEGRTVYFTAMAAYQMSLAEPDSLRVKELRSLMKLLNENRRLVMDQKLKNEKLTLETMTAALKVRREQSEVMTKKDFERMVMDTGEILRRARGKGNELEEEDEDENNSKSSSKQASPSAEGGKKSGSHT